MSSQDFKSRRWTPNHILTCEFIYIVHKKYSELNFCCLLGL